MEAVENLQINDFVLKALGKALGDACVDTFERNTDHYGRYIEYFASFDYKGVVLYSSCTFNKHSRQELSDIVKEYNKTIDDFNHIIDNGSDKELFDFIYRSLRLKYNKVASQLLKGKNSYVSSNLAIFVSETRKKYGIECNNLIIYSECMSNFMKKITQFRKDIVIKD